jgi:hypothetical protein
MPHITDQLCAGGSVVHLRGTTSETAKSTQMPLVQNTGKVAPFEGRRSRVTKICSRKLPRGSSLSDIALNSTWMFVDSPKHA